LGSSVNIFPHFFLIQMFVESANLAKWGNHSTAGAKGCFSALVGFNTPVSRRQKRRESLHDRPQNFYLEGWK
jgi:hypothetical protein